MKTQMIFEEEAREKIFKGVEKMYKAVSTTLGPMGRNVAIARTNMQGQIYQRTVLHDGVSIAKAIQLEDEFENMGAQILKESAMKTVDQVGDGTTVTIILAHAIISEARKLIAAGVNSMSLRKELEEGVNSIVSQIEKLSTPVKSLDQKIQIATISAEDSVLGTLVANTLHSVGVDGIVTVEESKSPETTVETQKGMLIDRGFASPYFVTDPMKMEATLENTSVLVTDYPVMNFQEIIGFLDNDFLKQSRILTVFAPDFGGDALPSFIRNKLEGTMLTLCVPAPMDGMKQKEILRDIAVLTGATYISKDTGRTLKTLKFSDLGKAGRITSKKGSTLIVDGAGSKEEIDARIESIKSQIEDSTEWDALKLQERLAKLTNGVAVIKAGGATEIEMSERYERIKDAVEATKAATKGGLVPGGETVYLQVKTTNLILREALKKPFYKLVSNAGQDPGELYEQFKGKTQGHGFDVSDNKWKFLPDAGIVDPTLVSIEALKNALSVAIQLITTDCIIVPKEDKK